MHELKKIAIVGMVLVALSISAIYTRSELVFAIEAIVAFALAFATVESIRVERKDSGIDVDVDAGGNEL